MSHNDRRTRPGRPGDARTRPDGACGSPAQPPRLPHTGMRISARTTRDYPRSPRQTHRASRQLLPRADLAGRSPLRADKGCHRRRATRRHLGSARRRNQLIDTCQQVKEADPVGGLREGQGARACEADGLTVWQAVGRYERSTPPETSRACGWVSGQKRTGSVATMPELNRTSTGSSTGCRALERRYRLDNVQFPPARHCHAQDTCALNKTNAPGPARREVVVGGNRSRPRMLPAQKKGGKGLCTVPSATTACDSPPHMRSNIDQRYGGRDACIICLGWWRGLLRVLAGSGLQRREHDRVAGATALLFLPQARLFPHQI